MRIRSLIDVTDNPNFISGIHNYCDRWCERCSFTSRCRVYAAEEADPDIDPASRDISNAAFWQKIASILKEAQEMISAWAEENGVDLSPALLAEVGEQQDKLREEAENHPLARAAEEYALTVNQWFESFEQMEVFSDTSAAPDENGPDDDINDYVEVIRWYQFFIPAKMIRGLLSRVDEDDYLDDADSRDSDGSVKAALIAMDRSIGAWKLVGEFCRESADSIQKFLLALEKLRLGAEEEFPLARDFIRPGFDEYLDRLH